MDIHVTGKEIKSIAIRTNEVALNYEVWDEEAMRAMRLKFLHTAADIGPDDEFAEMLYT